MPRDDRTYSQAMRAYEEEKKFLRRARHRAFHPDYDSPFLFRLIGYLIRLVVIAVIILSVFFVRNRGYFNSEGFSEGVREELDHFIGGEDSKLEKVYWKGDQAVTQYKASGSERAFFQEIDLPRIAVRATKRDLLWRNDWQLRGVEIGNATVLLKAGTSSANDSAEVPDRVRAESWWTAVPDFSRTRFGTIDLHEAAFSWGPHWTSKGSLENAAGEVKRQLGEWSLSFTEGVFQQNWLQNLTIVEEHPLEVEVKPDAIHLRCEQLQLGKQGQVTLNGIVTLSEMPNFDIQLDMKSVELTDLLPPEYQETVSGLVDIKLTLSGSTNRSDGIIFNGELRAVDTGRLREIPILQTLSVVTPRIEMRHMPIRIGSSLKFNSRQGKLTVTEIALRGGGSAATSSGYATESGDELDIANIRGHLSYQMDTSVLDQNLVLEDIQRRREIVEQDSDVQDPNLGFKGEITVRMPWELLDEDEGYRDQFFTQDAEGYGYIVVPVDGNLDDISKKQAQEMDKAWAELTSKQQNPFSSKRD